MKLVWNCLWCGIVIAMSEPNSQTAIKSLCYSSSLILFLFWSRNPVACFEEEEAAGRLGFLWVVLSISVWWLWDSQKWRVKVVAIALSSSEFERLIVISCLMWRESWVDWQGWCEWLQGRFENDMNDMVCQVLVLPHVNGWVLCWNFNGYPKNSQIWQWLFEYRS